MGSVEPEDVNGALRNLYLDRLDHKVINDNGVTLSTLPGVEFNTMTDGRNVGMANMFGGSRSADSPSLADHATLVSVRIRT